MNPTIQPDSPPTNRPYCPHGELIGPCEDCDHPAYRAYEAALEAEAALLPELAPDWDTRWRDAEASESSEADS